MIPKGVRSDKIRRLYREAVRQGWSPRVNSRGHIELRSPAGKTFTVSTTSSGSGRDFENTKAIARRAGLDVTGIR